LRITKSKFSVQSTCDFEDDENNERYSIGAVIFIALVLNALTELESLLKEKESRHLYWIQPGLEAKGK
jgi:hypothetical protein